MRRADLHLHTSFSGWRSLRLIDPRDCYVDPSTAFDAARRRGMDYVCLTDHETIDGAHDLLSRRPEVEPYLIVGEEVEARFPDSSQWIHLNVYGVDEALHHDLTRLRGNCLELIRELHERRVFFVLNHPFQSFRSIARARQHLSWLLPLVPAVELLNSTSPRSHRPVIEEMLDSLPRLPVLVAGSDAHTVARIGTAHTLAPGDTKEAFLDSIRRGDCLIGGDARGGARLLPDLYTIIGAYYRQLYGQGYEFGPWRRAKNILFSGLLLPVVLSGVPAVLTLLHTLQQEWLARRGGWGRLPALPPAEELPAWIAASPGGGEG